MSNDTDTSASAMITLPPRPDGKPLRIPSSTRQLVIIGANGAGKSRFTARLAEDLGDRTFTMSALTALFGHPSTPTGIDRLFELAYGPTALRPSAETELDRLLALLMHDEMINLIAYKVARASDQDATLQPTRIDRLIKAWKEIFPGNNILIESGRFLFSRPESENTAGYSALKLSNGEKAAIYYLGAVLYAPPEAAVLVDSPEMFLHPSVMQALWNSVEAMRPDCMFVYTTHDLEFASSRTDATVVWVRDYNPVSTTWDYDLLTSRQGLSDEIYMAIIGARKPVLFIEGDGIHSIDAKLYPLIFKAYTVKSLGSCNKVIEATRSFNDLAAFHHMDSHGIVDRDRRDDKEVEYLRKRKIMVPDVAEIENILMLEDVIRTVASSRGKDENRVFEKVRHAVFTMFRTDLRQQALLHTRHRVKRTVEYRIDGRFTNINMFEQHINSLVDELNPRGLYEKFCRDFRRYLDTGDYRSVLKVYNQKSMVPGSNVAGLCGLGNKDDYVRAIIALLRQDKAPARRIRLAVMRCFGIDDPSEIDPTASTTRQ